MNYNPLVTDGLYPYTCVSNSSKPITISADEYVEVRMVFGAEGDERFDWTRFDVLPPVCTFTTSGSTWTLDADCDTDTTIKVPNGVTLDGNGHKITVVDPVVGAFAGAVVENEGVMMHVKNLTVDGNSNGANNCVAVFNGVAFMHAGGSIKNVTLTNIGRQTGCQAGRAILVNAIGDATKQSVTIEGNTVTSYNKNGIDVRGNVDAKIVGNTVTGRGQIDYIAQNGIVVIGASALIDGNVVSGNSYLPTDVVSYGILVIDATGVKKKQNALSGNEADFGNFGARRRQDQRLERKPAGVATPTPDSPARQLMHREARSGGPLCASARQAGRGVGKGRRRGTLRPKRCESGVKSRRCWQPCTGVTGKPSRGVMPKVGIEPTLPEGNRILSPARLPVPPLRPAEAC